MSDVHPRLRKHLSRCTLDCGFKTLESPALRGFEAGPRALATAALYLVLKSNGLRHSKNLPVKFGFSPRTVPANIAKKLPAQRCSKPHFIAFFSLSHKRPTFAFAGESGYTTRLSAKDRTQRLTRRNRAHFGLGAITTLGTFHTFTNIPGPGIRTANFAALGSWPGGALEERRKPSGQRCAYACRCPEGVAAPLGCVICLQLGDVAVFSLCTQYFLNVRGGGGITTFSALCVLLKYRTAACQNGSFAVF